MLYYIYDGSFEGLLTAIYEAYYRRQHPDAILSIENLQENLFIEYVQISTDPKKANRVFNSIKSKISSEALRHVSYVFLSELENRGTLIYQYLKLGWKLGRKVDEYLSDNRVLNVHNISRKVSGEAHRMMGLVRFQLLAENIYYSKIEPDYNIISLIAPHFAARMADQDWAIHDIRRNLAALCRNGRYIIIPLSNPNFLILHPEEEQYQELWKQYFSKIAIESRIKPRLQRQYMPKRYWKHLIEIPSART